MTTRAPKTGDEWFPKATPDSALDPDKWFGCKNVLELSRYYRVKKERGFSVRDMVAAVVNSNDGFCDRPIMDYEWPRVQLAILLLAINEEDLKFLEASGMFLPNRGH